MTASGSAHDLLWASPDPAWQLTVEGWEPGQEAAVESVCAMVNGYLGVRAAVEEGSSASGPGTYLNGVFDAARGLAVQAAATPEHQVTAAPTSELVKAPDWSRIGLVAGGQRLDLDSVELLEQRRTLDLSRGALVREWRVRTGQGTTRLRSLRFASLDDRHVLGQVLEITPEDWTGPLALEAIVDGDVTNEGGGRHLLHTATERRGDALLLSAVTAERSVAICMAAWALLTDGRGGVVAGSVRCTERSVAHRWELGVEPGRTYTLQKLVAASTSRDGPDPGGAAAQCLQRAVAVGIPGVLDASARAWAERWSAADIVIPGEETIQRQTRFALYHLIGSANPHDEHASPGARALTGERYKGHVFWDTEVFVLPFFVFTHPPTARALLMYRYHTLPAARARAWARGYAGALYAWESTDSGEDLTPSFVINAAGERLEILTGEQEHHISADVGYAICQYWDATDDAEFMLESGAEMLMEIARFWASRTVGGDDGRLHILGVIGPDEYHEGVDDNAYTNHLARHVLRRAADTARWLRARHPARWGALRARLALAEGEVAAWADVARRLVDNRDQATGLIEQHRGFFGLEPVDLEAYAPRGQTMDVLLGWHDLVRTQILKQADVLMLPAMLPEEFPRHVVEVNYRYYEPRTAHDSSLSPSIHALVAARLGDRDDAERYFRTAARIDLDLAGGVTAAGGVHIAALGGMWQALVFGFGGLTVGDRGLTMQPNVPAPWGGLRIPLQWRGTRHVLRLEDGVAEPDTDGRPPGRHGAAPDRGLPTVTDERLEPPRRGS